MVPAILTTVRGHLLLRGLVLLSVGCGTQEDPGAKPASLPASVSASGTSVAAQPPLKTRESCTEARARAEAAAELRTTFVHATEGPAGLEQMVLRKHAEQVSGKPEAASAQAALAAADAAVTTAKQAVLELESCTAAIKTRVIDGRARCAAADAILDRLLAAQRRVAATLDAAKLPVEDAQGIKSLITNGEDAWKVVGEPGPLATLVTAYDGCAF